jgi:hypothetical protein
MSFPLEPMPTVRQFVDAAIGGGYKEHYHEIRSSQGVIRARHLSDPIGKVLYPLPLDEDDRLAPETMASIARATGTRVYSHLYRHLLDNPH